VHYEKLRTFYSGFGDYSAGIEHSLLRRLRDKSSFTKNKYNKGRRGLRPPNQRDLFLRASGHYGHDCGVICDFNDILFHIHQLGIVAIIVGDGKGRFPASCPPKQTRGTGSQHGLFSGLATGSRGHQPPGTPSTEESMLYWALMFLIIAIIAGFLGFGGIAFAAAGIAKILFFIFLIVFAVMLLTGLMGRRSPPI
jgi:uncharacterized membrane protein YtjA (UPF0391 family)